MTCKATKQPNKIEEPEVQLQESNACKTAQTNSDTSPFDKEFNEPDTKKLNLNPNILSKSPGSNRPGVSPVNANAGSDSEDEPFKPWDKGLLVTRGFVNGYPALMLIDPSAGINHISADFCKRSHIRTKPAPYKVYLANKSTENMNVTRNKVTISIGSYSESFRMASNSLKYDVILWKKWFAKHKATIDCERKIVKIFHRYKKLTIRALANSNSEISVNAKELKDKTAEIFAIALKLPDQSISLAMHKDICSLIHEYHDVFSEKLPNGLSPSRGKDFSIELMPDAKP